jgi:hypothetical protein
MRKETFSTTYLSPLSRAPTYGLPPTSHLESVVDFDPIFVEVLPDVVGLSEVPLPLGSHALVQKPGDLFYNTCNGTGFR